MNNDLICFDKLCTTRKCCSLELVLFIYINDVFFSYLTDFSSGLTLEGDSGEKVALWLLTSLCTSAKREVEVAL